MFYDPNDDRSYIYFVKLPLINQKFAVGCKNLRSASIGYIIDLAKDVGEKSNYIYTEEPLIFCLEISKIISDDTSLSFCISRGYSFQVLNGLNEVQNIKTEGRIVYASNLLLFSKSKTQNLE